MKRGFFRFRSQLTVGVVLGVRTLDREVHALLRDPQVVRVLGVRAAHLELPGDRPRVLLLVRVQRHPGADVHETHLAVAQPLDVLPVSAETLAIVRGALRPSEVTRDAALFGELCALPPAKCDEAVEAFLGMLDREQGSRSEMLRRAVRGDKRSRSRDDAPDTK